MPSETSYPLKIDRALANPDSAASEILDSADCPNCTDQSIYTGETGEISCIIFLCNKVVINMLYFFWRDSKFGSQIRVAER